VSFDPRRSPPAAALTALRYVEDLAHRVRTRLVREEHRSDPVAWLIRTHRSIHRDSDGALIARGYRVAERLHRGQMRKSGEPYITHPLAVAQILAELGMDTTTLVAALLHDTVEDTTYTMRELTADFGAEVALLVDGVTKFDRVFYGETAEVETIRKMLVKAGVDVRVLVVKLADRLHNMQTIDARSAASRSRIARATQEVLIPLCDRLGIQALKRDLEDSVLAALHPEQHAVLRSMVAFRPEWTAYVDEMKARAASVMREHRIDARVISRPRHLYSIWKDTYGQGHDTPYELPRIAIIVNRAENDCYTALGAVHTTWRPAAGRFKDFIASPKNNLYRSLHTTVIGPDSRSVEILIRTESMHRNAEYGIIAAYRFGRRGPGAHSARGRLRRGGPGGINGGEHLEWLHRVVDWQRAAVSPGRFLESLRCDLAEGQVHVFVEGTRILLPAHSTPVDVAYSLGPEIGDRCVAATVNGQLTFLSSPLADGDVVEIHTAGPEETAGPDGAQVGPAPEWLGFVRTPNAQLHIERRLGLSTADDPNLSPPVPFQVKVQIGRRAIDLALHRRERGLVVDMPLLALAGEMGYPDVPSLLVAVTDHVVSADEVAERLIVQVDNGSVGAAVSAAGAPIKP
jgi:GTP diphosphokinase / guanosine-3',5'-bis(diphosphate) 3'-diphosphatase